MDVYSALAREKARSLDSLLNELVSSIENVRLGIRATVPRPSLCNIPDEVILEILQLVCTNLKSVVDISLVCKKLRCFTLSPSKLWAGSPLTLNTPSKVIDKIASLSGSNGINVRIENRSDNWTEPMLDRLRKLFEHCAQWKSLVVVKGSQVIRAHFPNENLSRLVRLEISDDFEKYGSQQSSIYQDWSLPSLRILIDPTWLPPPSFASKVPNLIECCFTSKPSKFLELFSLLNAIPRLERLAVRVQHGNDNDNAISKSAKLHLPTLRSLKVISFSILPHTVADAISVLLCPGITHLTLCNEADSATSIKCWKLGLPSLRRLCPCLESFTLLVYGRTDREKLYFIDDILQNLPRTIKRIDLYLDTEIFSHDQDSFSEVLESTHPLLTSLIIKRYFYKRRGQESQEFYPQVAAQLKLRKINLKELSDIYYGNVIKETRNIFREVGVLYDGN